MKTKAMKIKKHLNQQAQVERWVQARLADLKKLRRAVWLSKHRIIAFFAAWFGFRLFNWEQRYDNKYVIKWAKQAGWSPARLCGAVDMVDAAMRVQANRVARARDAIRRRARNIMKWQRRQRENTAVTKQATFVPAISVKEINEKNGDAA